MGKSADAFRTISEVADWLETPAHVLRFWESKFSQVKPVKRAGGRRYYRPADMMLLGGIKKLLHDDGMTIKGVQKMLRDQGVKHVSDMAPALEDGLQDAAEAAITLDAVDQSPSDGAQVLDFARGPAKSDTSAPVTPDAEPMDEPREPELFEGSEAATGEPDTPPAPTAPPEPEVMSDADEDTKVDQPDTPERVDSMATPADPSAAPDPSTSDDTPDAPQTPAVPTFSHRSVEESPEQDAPLVPQDESAEDVTDDQTIVDPEATTPPEAPSPSPSPTPHMIDLPDDPPDTVDAGSGALSTLCNVSSPRDADTAKQLEQIAERVRALIKA